MVMRESDQAKLDSAQLAQLQAMASAFARKGIRKQSEYVFLGLPLYSIARGPDLSKGELSRPRQRRAGHRRHGNRDRCHRRSSP